MKVTVLENEEGIGAGELPTQEVPATVTDQDSGDTSHSRFAEEALNISEAVQQIKGNAALFDTSDPVQMGLQWANLFGVPATMEDVDFLTAVAHIVEAVDPTKLASDVIRTGITAAKSDNVVDDVAKGVMDAFGDAIRRGAIPKEDWDVVTKQVFGYALPYMKDNVDDFIKSVLDSTARWFVEGGTGGLNLPASMLLSAMYQKLPDAGKTALLAALSAVVDAKAAFNRPSTYTDIVTTIINAITGLTGEGTQILPIQAATNVNIQGVSWSVFPIANGYILIASQPVSGPDVILYSSDASKGVRTIGSKLAKVLSSTLGMVPMGDLVNAINRARIQPDVIRVVLDGASYDDTIKGVVARAMHDILEYAAGKLAPNVTQFIDQINTAVSNGVQDVTQLVKAYYRDLRKRILANPLPTSKPTEITITDELGPLDSGTQLSSIGVMDSTDPAVDSRLKRAGGAASEVIDERVDAWYTGRTPGSRGDRF